MNNDILSSRKQIADIDKSNVLGSVEALSDQVAHAWKDAQKVPFTPSAEIKNVIVAGMGGSGLGSDVIKTLFKHEFTIPYDVVHSYTLPGYVNQHSLVLLASYSGNTEEVLAAAEDAQQRKAQIMIICADGELAKIADAFHYPVYIIDPQFNPSNQPRMAIGYAVFGTVALFSKAGIISVTKKQVEDVIETLKESREQNTVEITKEKNQAKQIAYQIHQTRPVLIGAEHLEGALHVSANQFNENAKVFADYKIIPEINHHLMEGLKYPDTNQSTHTFVFINSSLYHPRNQSRVALTKQVVEQNGISTIEVQLRSKTRISQVFESISLFAYVNFYLAMLEGIDPAPIPFVNWFKEELKKR